VNKEDLIALLRAGNVIEFNRHRKESMQNESTMELSGADLRGAIFHGADLRGANLSGADLRGAHLYGANLSGADLRGAGIIGANLSGADLRGAKLNGVKLYESNLTGVNLDQPAVMWATAKGLHLVWGLPPGAYADAVAAGYKRTERSF